MAAFALGNLSLLLAIPVIGAMLLVLIPRQKSKALFTCALLFSSLAFLWSLNILNQFDGAKGEMQLLDAADQVIATQDWNSAVNRYRDYCGARGLEPHPALLGTLHGSHSA